MVTEVKHSTNHKKSTDIVSMIVVSFTRKTSFQSIHDLFFNFFDAFLRYSVRCCASYYLCKGHVILDNFYCNLQRINNDDSKYCKLSRECETFAVCFAIFGIFLANMHSWC